MGRSIRPISFRCLDEGALNLLRAHRYPQVAGCATGDLTPEVFLDGRANTIYVVAAGHEGDVLGARTTAGGRSR
jgi:hypothetical protein